MLKTLIISAIILFAIYAFSYTGKSVDDKPEIYPHQNPVVTENGNHLEIVAADDSISVKQGKALITHYRANLTEYTGAKDYLYGNGIFGQVVLRVPSGRAFIIYNEFPDLQGNHYIIDKP